MHARRMASFLFGLWLGGSLFMAWVASQSRNEVDRLFSRVDPVATLNLKPLGENGPRLLRYTAAEQNRSHERQWEWIQLIAGGAFLLIMLFGSREDKFILLGLFVLLLVVALQRFLITPELTALGRLLDFAPPNELLPDRNRYWIVETAFTAVEAGKWAILLILTGQMVFSRKRSGRSRDARRKLDRVDKPDYRGVYR
jgi:hypothetical protein